MDGPLYEFNGLSVDCIDKHQPNSEERRRAYQADITFGTNNEFGFDYLRDNMAMSPADLVQRQHNYAIVDEVDSVLIDDARTPLIISGPTPKGDDQMYEEYQPLVQKLYEVQRKQATEYLSDARRKIARGLAETDAKQKAQILEEGFLSLYRSYKALPKNKALIKFLSEDGIKSGMLKTEEYYMANNNREMPKAVEPSTSWPTRNSTPATSPTRVPLGSPPRSMTTSSSSCPTSPPSSRSWRRRRTITRSTSRLTSIRRTS